MNDLFLHRDDHEIGFREAAIWSSVWIAVGLGFGVLLWAWQGSEVAATYYAGYLRRFPGWDWLDRPMDTPRPPVERRHPPDALLRAVNPLIRWLLDRGRLGNQLLVLHYTGRRTGRRFDVPAGYHVIDGVVSVLTNSSWRHNFTGGKEIDVTLRGRRQGARAVLVDDPTPSPPSMNGSSANSDRAGQRGASVSASTWTAHRLMASCVTRSSDQAFQSSRFATEQRTTSQAAGDQRASHDSDRADERRGPTSAFPTASWPTPKQRSQARQPTKRPVTSGGGPPRPRSPRAAGPRRTRRPCRPPRTSAR